MAIRKGRLIMFFVNKHMLNLSPFVLTPRTRERKVPKVYITQASYASSL
jgi:hypothetical protein